MELKNHQWRASTNYKIHEMLGEGSHSQVYRAQREIPDLDLNQTVAIKILKSKNAVEMWRKEFTSLAQVKSPYCVQVFAFEQSGELPALVLEYVDGLNLKDLVQYGALTETSCMEILAQIHLGLLDLQRAGLCHGDLSPKNVMIDRLGQVRLLDFGTANSKQEAVAFTPGFAAPEIMSKKTQPNFKSDLYSLGAIGSFIQRHSSPMSLCMDSLLLSEPTERVCKFGAAETGRQSDLAFIVQAACEKKKALSSLSTKTCFTSTHLNANGFLSFKLLNYVAVMLLVVSVSSSQTAYSLRHTISGNVRIRTASWHLIEMDGHNIGYAPIDLYNIQPGPHVLHWKNARGSGTVKFQVQSGQVHTFTEGEMHSY